MKYIDKHSKEIVTVKIKDSGHEYYDNVVNFKDGGEICVCTNCTYKRIKLNLDV